VGTGRSRIRSARLEPARESSLIRHGPIVARVTASGKPAWPSRQETISVAFGRLMREISLDGVTHHVLRHTGASAMVAAGISPQVVQDSGDWSTLGMLEGYAHPSDGETSRAVRVLTAYTTGTKTGTATKNWKRDRKKGGAASVDDSEVSEWRPQCPPVGTKSPAGSSRSTGCVRRPEHLPVSLRSRTVAA
jgi:hypothetical protein